VYDNTHIIAAIVEHKPGVLYNVANLFRRRGFNIENISVGRMNGDLARITIMVKGDEKTIEQVVKQLNKLIDVIKVSRLIPTNTVAREMALIKVNVPDAKARSEIVNYVNVFRGRIVDVAPDTVIVEITGGSSKLDAFLNVMNGFSIREMARTGITALSRGAKSVKIEE
jgi:acetolactate synthase-1/3 small subunit